MKLQSLTKETYRRTLYPIYRYITDCYIKKGKLPFYYNLYIKKKCYYINRHFGDLKFIFLSDLHWGANYRLSPILIKRIMNNTNISKVFSGGDVVTESDVDKKSMISLWRNFTESFSFLGSNFYQIYGNHDNNSFHQSNNKAIFSNDEIYSLQYIGDAKRFGNGYSYYVDDKSSFTRIICLDTGKQYLNDDDYNDISDILKSAPSNWHILIFTHLIIEWIDKQYQSRDYIIKLLDMLDNHNGKSSSKVEAIFAGHIHNDYHTMTKGGIPIIAVGSDAYGVACGKYKKSIAPFHEQCLTLFNLNYSLHTILGVRIGRGKLLNISY